MMYQGTKAQVIKLLHEKCKLVNTLPYYIVNSDEFMSNKSILAERICKMFYGQKLIVRSSCSCEDTLEASNAGKYESLLNVDSDEKSVLRAIELVYGSYDSDSVEEILIQPMLKDIIKSGVIFTKDIYTRAPYYCIDYYEGCDSAAVTSGYSSDDKCFILYRDHDQEIADEDIRNIIATVKIIEDFFQDDELDIEFAINEKHEVYIFQVRPLAKMAIENSEKLDIPLKSINKKIEKLMRPHPFLLGRTTFFGVMPDWNPAEILGVRPKKLAISLYKELITDNIWAHQREDYGYRNLTQHPLMVLFCGIPYIDTRITFNSFIPAMLNDKIAEKLVDYYLNELKKYPSYHDKIEFEIVFSCYYFGLPDDLEVLAEYGFNSNEIRRIEFSLLDLTNRIINPQDGLYKKDICKVEILKDKHKKIMQSDISTVDKIYWLIEVCKKYGTLPFAGVARAAFIAIQFLRSFVKKEIITEEEYNSFMVSLNTISKQLGNDRKRMFAGEISAKSFLEKYGHIRPGTYDILSPRYDEAFEYYFDDGYIDDSISNSTKFEFSELQIEKINMELEENGLCVDADELICFIREAIEGREYTKFIFTKTVSEIIKQIEKYGKRLGISKNDLAHLDISLIKQLYTDLYYGNISNIFQDNINQNKKQYEVAKLIKLPALIISPSDVYGFLLMEEEPNFITMNIVSGKVVLEEDIHDTDLAGKIIFIKSADPGYDFLFTKSIAGLITQFGGVNSHMAIRCSELGIPAIIGAGEKKYTEWSKARVITLDCEKRDVKVVE